MADYSNLELYPVRCYTCNAPIGKWQLMMEKMQAQGYTMKQCLDKFKINRECCRMNVMSPGVYVAHVKVDNPSATIVRRLNDDVTKMMEQNKITASQMAENERLRQEIDAKESELTRLKMNPVVNAERILQLQNEISFLRGKMQIDRTYFLSGSWK